jgi:HAD superfamily hydrolase (TIGR01509 family)
MAMTLKAMLFDLDGTVTRPLLDFPAIKREIGIPTDSFILEELEGMTPQERKRAMDIVERHEREAAEKSELNDGARPLMEELTRRGIRTGVITRNSHESLLTVLRLHGLSFDVHVTRDHAEPKPSPAGITMALRQLGLAPGNAVYVGDHAIDVEAGRAAGTRTIWVTNGRGLTPPPAADYQVSSPGQIIPLLDELFSH